MAQSRREETSETPGEVPAQPSRASGTTSENKFDPISVASAALNASEPESEPEPQERSGFLSRFRSRNESTEPEQPRDDLPPDSWGRAGSGKDSLDPLAVTRQALSAQAEDADETGDDGSGTPLRERIGNLVERARSAVTPEPGSEDDDRESPGQSQAHTESPSETKATGQSEWATAFAPRVEPQPEVETPPPAAQTEDPARPEGSAAPETASSHHEAGPDDAGWVFHRKVAEDGFEGWLYHYADGTMVNEAGVVYEYPSHEPDSLSQDPSATSESDAGSHARERSGEAPTRVADQDAEAAGEPEAPSEHQAASQEQAPSEPPAESPAVVEAAQEGLSTEEPESQASAPPEASAPTEPVEEEPADQGSAEAADRDDEASESTSDDEDPEPRSDDSAESSGPQQDGADEDAPVPQVEGAGGPLAAVTETVTGTWLNEKAEGKQPLPPKEEEPAGEAHEGAETVYIPRFIEYSPSNLLRYVSGGMFAVAAIAAVMTIFYGMQAASAPYLVLGGAFILLALLASWVLLSWEPTIISIREGILEIAKGPTGEQVDLRDPRTKVDVGSNVGSPLWRMTVHRSGDKDLTVHAGQVKARQFAAIVEHHLRHPRQKSEDSED